MKITAQSIAILALAAVGFAAGCAQPQTSSYSSTDQWRAENRRAGLIRDGRELPTAMPDSSTAAMLNMHAPIASPQSAAATSTMQTSLPSYSSPASTPPTLTPTPSLNPTATSPRASRALNLFGELNTTSAIAGTPLDGATNLVQVSFATEGNCVDPDIDSTGTLITFASTMHRKTSDIYIKAVNGRTMTQITSDPADDVMPAFSPDGTRIAFASNRSGNWDIYVTSVNGGPATQITNEGDAELHPTWSPDGRSLAFCRFGAQSARWEIWMTDVAGTNGTTDGANAVKRFLDYGVFPEWCPDVTRSKIAFQRAKQRGSRDYGIWTIDITNGQASQPTEIVSAANAALINPCWSPDGSRIAFVAIVEPAADGVRSLQSDVWVVNIDGSGRTNLTSGQFANFQPAWAADGSVYFVSDRSGIDNVWAVQSGRNDMINKPQPQNMANADNGSANE